MAATNILIFLRNFLAWHKMWLALKISVMIIHSHFKQCFFMSCRSSGVNDLTSNSKITNKIWNRIRLAIQVAQQIQT